MGLGIAFWVVAIIMKILWRLVQDNIHFKKLRKEPMDKYKTPPGSKADLKKTAPESQSPQKPGNATLEMII